MKKCWLSVFFLLAIGAAARVDARPLADRSLADYPRLAGEADDTARIRRAVADCADRVLYFPAGEYAVSGTVSVTNLCSLLLHKSAVIRAAAAMKFVVDYDASLQGRAAGGEDFGLFIQGGVIDGDGLASCLAVSSFHHFTLRDMTFRNGLRYGLRVQEHGHSSYELVANNLYGRCLKPGLAGNIGISVNGGDSHYTDCILVDYTVGIEVTGGGSSRFTRCHVWGGPLPPAKPGEEREMLKDSVNFRILGGADTVLRDCYGDTGKTGFLIGTSARLFGCAYYNNYLFKLDDVTCIEHRGNAPLLVSGCLFTKTSPKATVFKGGAKNVIWRDNLYNRFPPESIPADLGK